MSDDITILRSQIATLERANEALRREAEQWKGEALAHKSSLHEAYQVLTGATGEPANWNGARPFRQYQLADRDAFTIWLRRWAKARFGKWITHNTVRGAFSDFAGERSRIVRETLAATSILNHTDGDA